MRKILALRLVTFAFLVGICGLSVYANPVFSVKHDVVREIAIDSTKTVLSKTGVMPIPEPTTLILFGTGLAALAGKRIKTHFRK